MHRCTNALCCRLISTSHRHGFIRAEVVGITQYWCSAACFEQWKQQNAVFTEAADPFARRARTYSEHRRHE